MSYVTTHDGVNLHYEEAGTGAAIIFVHEFAADYRNWESQMRYFSRLYRCVAFNARGYPPSDVPPDVESYTQRHAIDDIKAVMDGLGIERAHIVGVSMGGMASVHFAIAYPERCLSIVPTATGSGAALDRQAEFRAFTENMARDFIEKGTPEVAKGYSQMSSRIQLEIKDPRGYKEFCDMLAGHSAIGSAQTMRGVVGRRPSVYQLADELAAIHVPTLIVCGDEDDLCIEPSIYMKRHIPSSGLLMLPKTGHMVNLEEPGLYNQQLGLFFAAVEAGKWLDRDPRCPPVMAL